jgi:hypothetical protein
VWDGFDNKQYLDIGTFSIQMGDSAEVRVGSMIEGVDRAFSGTVQIQTSQTNPAKTTTRNLVMVVKFEDFGAAPKGSVEAQSQYSCTNCTNNDNQVVCASTITFVGRRIDASPQTDHPPTAADL